MELELRLSVFRFDASCDYLPFYKKHIIKIEDSKTLDDLLALIKEEDRLFDYPVGRNAAISILGKNLFTKTKISAIVEAFGEELTLLPMNQKRTTKDLIINTEDFYKKFDLIDPFVVASDKKIFEKLIIYHYASDVYDYTDDFQGDALFLFAYEMAKKYPGQAKQIFNIIDNKETGIWLHTDICNKVFPFDFEVEKKISDIKNEISRSRSQI
ncbi:MAG: DUF5644 domain-containing protein [Sulfurospirillaceae bacterium]|nr:DUF5644 domain-containing protein [Sulfurospirillaceae bacterium]